jgi:hypothetical protein
MTEIKEDYSAGYIGEQRDVPISYQPPNVATISILATAYTDQKELSGDPRFIFFNRKLAIHVGRMNELISASAGQYLDLAIVVQSPDYAKDIELKNRITAKLRNSTTSTRVLQKWYQKNELFVPLGLLYEEENVINIDIESIGKHGSPTHRARLIVTNRKRVIDELEKRSIFVFSSPRSGSTWLSHDILCWKHQNRPMDETGLGQLLAPFELAPERFFLLETRDQPYEFEWSYKNGALFRRSAETPPFERYSPEVARTEPMEQLLSYDHRRMFCSHVRELALDHVLNVWGFSGFDRVIFKCPVDSLGADILMEAMPEAFMIFLVRDGRDVIKSQFSPFISPLLANTKDEKLRRYAVAFYAHYWNFQTDVIQAAYDTHSEDRRSFVRYEDLRRDPNKEISKLFDHLGIVSDESELNNLITRTKLENLPAESKGPDKARQSGQIGGFKERFDASEIQLMNSIMGEKLRNFGYLIET